MNGHVGATSGQSMRENERNGDHDDDGFVMPSEVVEVAGLLFDMDGTIIDSTAAVIKHWTQIGDELGIDPNVILATSHGRRSIDVLRSIDPANATQEYVTRVEGELPKKFGADAVEIPGARALLNALNEQKVPWTVVTSGSRALVGGWIEALDLPCPRPVVTASGSVSAAVKGSESVNEDVKTDEENKRGYMEMLVTAEDVDNGKPDPACYKLGRQRLFDIDESLNEHNVKPVLVLEDAPAGIQAGYDAGCRVVGLATSHSIEQLRNTEAEWVVRDMRSVRSLGVNQETGMVRIEISRALKR